MDKKREKTIEIMDPSILGCIHEIKNTGVKFEEYIYNKVKRIIDENKSKVYLYKKYYSSDRQDYITVDISIEKYVYDKLFSIIVIECKDYKSPLPVDDVEEFHAKLQQIGADNTKGVTVVSEGRFQKVQLNIQNLREFH